MSEPLYGFRQPLDVRLLPDGRWELLTEWRYLSAVTQKAYTIFPGFTTDFASVPRVPIAYWLAGNTAHLASVVHDYLYVNGEEPKDICDAIFAEIMERTPGFPKWRIKLMWLAVHLFGRDHYIDPESTAKSGFAA